jgi:DNA-binding CsgD family transcriptional regulator
LPPVTEPTEKLLDLIYDTASDEALWATALTQIADITGSVGGHMFGADNRARLVTFTFKGRLSEEADQVYRERHVSNPLAAVMNHSPVGKLVRTDDIMPLAALRRTALYNEVFRPQDVAHMAMVPLAAKDSFQVGCTVCRSERQGPFGEEELRFISQLYPHLRRALLLGFRLDGYRALQGAAFHLLDRLSAGIVILDRGSGVVFSNSAARSMALDGGPLRLRNAGVTTALPSHSHRLEKLIEAARRGMPAATMSVPHPQDGRLFTVLVSSIRSRDIDRFSGLGMRDPAVMLVVTDALRPLDIPAEWIVDAYGLTRAEANVALVAASGATVPEVAHRLSVSPNTVKTHLRRVFAKTGVARQTELARLMASLALVKANDPISSDPNGS